MNDTIGENGLMPSHLVFRIIPRFQILSTYLPNHKERMDEIQKAQAEMICIVVDRGVQEALTKNIPPAADRNYNLGDEVLIYSEQTKQWIGPFKVIQTEGRMIAVQQKGKPIRNTFNAFQVKRFFPEYEQNLYQFKTCPL